MRPRVLVSASDEDKVDLRSFFVKSKTREKARSILFGPQFQFEHDHLANETSALIECRKDDF